MIPYCTFRKTKASFDRQVLSWGGQMQAGGEYRARVANILSDWWAV